MQKVWIIQAYNEALKQWFNCYSFKFSHYEEALNHKNFMDKEYSRLHRLIERTL